MPSIPAAASTFPRGCPLHSSTATAPSFPANFFQTMAPPTRSTPELPFLFPSSALVRPLSRAARFLSIFTTLPLDMSLLSLTLPRTYLPFHRARLASFALVPFPSSFRPAALRFLLLFVPKNDGVEGRAAKRDGKDESNKEGEILEHGDKRRGGFHRLTVVGGRREGRFPVVGIFLDVERRRTHTHQAEPPRLYLRTLFLLQRCNRRLYYFRERERKCSERRKTGVENGRGLFDTRGGREEGADAKVIAQLVTQTDPSSFSSSGATCVSRARAYLPV